MEKKQQCYKLTYVYLLLLNLLFQNTDSHSKDSHKGIRKNII